jgi:hypothetical protein
MDFLLDFANPPPLPDKTWIEAACLWRELSQQIESALVTNDDDWLNELAKAIRGEAEPEHNAQFTSKVLVLLQRMAGATASDIYEQLEKHSVWVKKGRAEIERISVERNLFTSKQAALDAINDIAAKVDHELKRFARPSPS